MTGNILKKIRMLFIREKTIFSLIVICTFISGVILCFCFGLFCDYIEEPLATVREKSIQYVKGQLGETLPVFLVFLIMTVMSTICVSVLEVKQHIRNLYIYRIVGIDKAGCFRIQLLVNIIILCETILITALACAVLKKFGTDIIFLEFGLWQLIICISIIIFWLGIVYMVQKIMLGDHELWRTKR